MNMLYKSIIRIHVNTVELLSDRLCRFYLEKREIKWILICSHGITWSLSHTPINMLSLLGI